MAAKWLRPLTASLSLSRPLAASLALPIPLAACLSLPRPLAASLSPSSQLPASHCPGQPLTTQTVSRQPLTTQTVSRQPLTAQWVSCQPLTVQALVRSWASRSIYEICDAAAAGQVFLPLFRFPSVSHYTNAPCSASCFSYQKAKRENPGNLPQSNALSQIMQHWREQHL